MWSCSPLYLHLGNSERFGVLLLRPLDHAVVKRSRNIQEEVRCVIVQSKRMYLKQKMEMVCADDECGGGLVFFVFSR